MEPLIHAQAERSASPWTTRQRIKMFLWEYTWLVLCSWTPKPANGWRIFWLRVFGAKLYGRPFVHQRARIQLPWNLIMHHDATVGDRANIYSLGLIELRAYSTVAQEAYICTGTHAFERPELNLITSPIRIGEHAFVGARAFVLPGITIGERAIVGACSVVTRDVAPGVTVAGNPAKPMVR